MLNFVKIISSEKDSLARRVIKFFRYGNSDVQTAIESAPHGIDSVPFKDLVGVYAKTSSSGKTALIGYLIKDRLADVGETRLFSTDEQGGLQTYIWLKNDATIEIGGGTDNMVRFSELETAFNQLKQDFNTFVTATYNTHTHISAAPASPTATPLPVGTSSSADISGAKIDEIKTL